MATTFLVVGVIATLYSVRSYNCTVWGLQYSNECMQQRNTVRYDCNCIPTSRVGGALATSSDPKGSDPFERPRILSEGLCANFGGGSAVPPFLFLSLPCLFSFSSLDEGKDRPLP